MMRVGIYSRKSVKSETGDSMENQEQLCRAYIAAHWPDAKIAVYEDAAVIIGLKTLRLKKCQKHAAF